MNSIRLCERLRWFTEPEPNEAADLIEALVQGKPSDHFSIVMQQQAKEIEELNIELEQTTEVNKQLQQQLNEANRTIDREQLHLDAAAYASMNHQVREKIGLVKLTNEESQRVWLAHYEGYTAGTLQQEKS